MKLKLHWILLPLVLAIITPANAGQRPDILWIVADDLGYGDVGFTGCEDISTPSIDAIAKSGVICRSAYSPHPFCGPSRAALMSGRYQQRFSFYGNPLPQSAPGYNPDFGLPESETCIAELLSSAGYRTAIVGKWHLGEEEKFHPLNHGFSDFFGFLGGGQSYYQTDLEWQSIAENGSKSWMTRPRAGESRDDYLTDLLSDEAARLITETDKEQPLFLYLAYNAPHTPMQATQHWLDQVDDIEDPLRHVYAAMVTAMDDGIGRVVDALREAGRLDNTLIVFTSDNGGIPPVNGASNLPLRGMKGNLLDGGIRVPTAFSWPAKLPAGTEFEHPVIGFDAYHTSAAAAGIPADKVATTDSKNLLPYLSGDQDGAPHKALFWKTGGRNQAAIRSGSQKLLSVKTVGDRVYDLARDQAEEQPLEDEEHHDELSAMLSSWETTLPEIQYDGDPESKWPEQSRAIGLTPGKDSIRKAKQRDERNARVLKSALPKSKSSQQEDEQKGNPGNAQASDPRFLRWGDQGDGTYANPILNGDFADSDVERDEENDRWVMITSTNHFSPGMTILESTDLVNWKYTGHAIPTITWEPEYNWDKMNGYRFGCWAGDLVRHNGEWLCYQIDFQSGLYLTRAKNIEGPWSEPVCLLKRKHWTDPAVFFDEEKKEAWLVCNWGKGSPPRPDQPHEIKLFKLSWDGSKLLDEGKTIFSGIAVEAAKIRRFNDQWYLMLIEWQGEGDARDRKQLCLRSTTDSLYGPYESRVVMEREKDSDRSACQGSLIEAPDGHWWFMHQLVQNGEPVFHGRPQCLQPVTWTDGWPLIGKDIDGDGIGEPIWHHEKPIESDSSFLLQTSDEFDHEAIGPQWNWNHEPRRERFSLTANPGQLRLIASKPVKMKQPRLKGAFWGAPNTLSQRQLGIGKTRVETVLDLAGVKLGLRAGLCHFSGSFPGYGGQFAVFGIRAEANGRRVIFFADSESSHTGPALEGDMIYLRSDTDFDQATFSWSTDGTSWHSTNYTYRLRFGNWRGSRPGLFCWNLKTDDPEKAGYVDIDWFRYAPSAR